MGTGAVVGVTGRGVGALGEAVSGLAGAVANGVEGPAGPVRAGYAEPRAHHGPVGGGGCSGAVFGSRSQIGSGWSPYRWVVTDWDDDGRADVIAIDASGALWFYPNKAGNGPITWGTRVQIDSGWQDLTIAAGKVDANDRADLFAIRNSVGILYYYRDGRGKTLVSFKGWSGYRIHTVDFDSDGRGDLIGINTAGVMKLYPNSGEGGTSMFPTTIQIGTSWGSYKTAAADYNLDNKPDIAAFSTDGVLYLYPNNGANGLGTREPIGSGWVSAGITAIG